MFAFATSRKSRNVFSAKGQPQWRRNVITVGLSLEDGCSLLVCGALEPTAGDEVAVSWVGAHHEDNSCWKVMLGLLECSGTFLLFRTITPEDTSESIYVVFVVGQTYTNQGTNEVEVWRARTM